MKIGVSSYSFRKYILETKCDYFKICDLAKEMGFDGIEFTPLEEKSYGITDDPMKTAAELKEYCAKIGLEIVAYTVGANLVTDTPEAEVNTLKARIDVAEALGAKVLRHDVCSKLRAKPLYTYKDAIAEMVPLIREVTDGVVVIPIAQQFVENLVTCHGILVLWHTVFCLSFLLQRS